MSNVKAFYDAIANDEALQTKLQKACKTNNGGYEEIILPIAKEAGFDFSMDDVTAYEESLKPADEPGDTEHRNVAGLVNAGYVKVVGCGCVLYGQGTWRGEPSPENKIYPEGWGGCSYVGSINCVKNG